MGTRKLPQTVSMESWSEQESVRLVLDGTSREMDDTVDVAGTGMLSCSLLCLYLLTLPLTGYSKVWDKALIRKVRKNTN